MIIAVTGETIIRGNLAELTQDFCAALDAIKDKAPEVILAAQAQYADDMVELLPTVDENKLAFCNTFASKFKKLNKENADD